MALDSVQFPSQTQTDPDWFLDRVPKKEAQMKPESS